MTSSLSTARSRQRVDAGLRIGDVLLDGGLDAELLLGGDETLVVGLGEALVVLGRGERHADGDGIVGGTAIGALGGSTGIVVVTASDGDECHHHHQGRRQPACRPAAEGTLRHPRQPMEHFHPCQPPFVP